MVPRDARPSAIPHAAYRLLLIRGCTIGSLHLLDIGRRQYWWIDRDGHLVDGAGEIERHLVVGVVHRLGAGFADVEGVVERLDHGKGMLQCLGRHYLAIHLERSGATLADTAHIVVGQRALTEPVVLEVIFDRMLAGGQDVWSLKASPLEVEQVIRVYRLAFYQIYGPSEETSSLVNDDTFGPALRHVDVCSYGVGGVEKAGLVSGRNINDRPRIVEDVSARCQARTRRDEPR